MAGDEAKKEEQQEEQKEGLSDAVKTQVVRAIGVWMFMFDMGRGNFAHQADQNLALALCGGDSVRTVQMQSYVTSASAVVQFASNQLVGECCDRFGRRPLLICFPMFTAILRLGVALVPCWPTLFAAELTAYMFGRVGLTPVHAALSDMYAGNDLAATTSQIIGTTKGVSRIMGNPVGVTLSTLGTPLANFGAAAAALCASGAAALRMPETRPPPDPSDAAQTTRRGSSNPLTFLKLFSKGWRLSVLTAASALADVAEFTFDVDNHLYIAVGMDARLIGAFMMCTGPRQHLSPHSPSSEYQLRKS